MEFALKYISTSDKQADPKSKKKVISDDAFAVGELLDQIRIQLFRSNRHG